MNSTALVVIDIQNDITKNYKDIIANLNRAIGWAKENGFAVVYIKHNNITEATRTFKPDTAGAELVADMDVISDNIFVKTKSNALTSEAFADFVAENRITDFIVTGADATACVKATSYNMAKSGYRVTVLSDCVTSYNKSKIPEMLDYYASKGCAVMTLDELISK